MDIEFVIKQISKKIEDNGYIDNENKNLLKDLFIIILNNNRAHLDKLQKTVDKKIYSFFNNKMPVIKQVLIDREEDLTNIGFFEMEQSFSFVKLTDFEDYFEGSFTYENDHDLNIVELFIYDEQSLNEIKKKLKIIINKTELDFNDFEIVKNESYNIVSSKLIETISKNQIEPNYLFLPYNKTSYIIKLKDNNLFEKSKKNNIKIYKPKALLDINKKLVWNIEYLKIKNAAREKLIDDKKVFEYLIPCNNDDMIFVNLNIIENIKNVDNMIFRTKEYKQEIDYYVVHNNAYHNNEYSNKTYNNILYPKGQIKAIGEIHNIFNCFEATKELKIKNIKEKGERNIKQVIDDFNLETKKYLKKEILILQITAPKDLKFISQRINFIANIIDSKINDYWIKPEIQIEK
jgi:hypothetical protein